MSHPSWELVVSLGEALGVDVARLLVGAGPEELRATANAQLATYTLSAMILDAVRRDLSAASLEAAQLTATAGHSLGEYTALHAAGALEAIEGARLVRARGEAMQAAAKAQPGTMAAVIGLGLEEVASACANSSSAWVANDNAPGQVVLAGSAPGVEQAGQAALGLGAKRVIGLQVGGAFHSPFMAAAQGPLDEALASARLAASKCPVVANVDARAHFAGFAAPLSAQLCSRVRWRESLLTLEEMGAQMFVELGPGTELTGMVRRTLGNASRANVATPADIEALGKALEASQRGPDG